MEKPVNNFLSNFLNRFTMYRLMLYFLWFLFVLAVVLSFFGVLSFDWLDILIAGAYLVTLCYTANRLFAYIAGVKPNYESAVISAIILTLILGPFSFRDGWIIYTLAGVAAMASKYILVFSKRHIFNPAAFGVLVTALALNESASWWVGNREMFILILLGGLLMVNHIRRFHLVFSFLGSYLGLLLADNLLSGNSLGVSYFSNLLLFSPLMFFSFVMLIEPLTGPQDRKLRIYYGFFIAIVLFVFQRFLSIPYSLELSLLVGNVFARILNPGFRLSLKLLKKVKPTNTISEFWFEPAREFSYRPGQFLEWSLAHPHADLRGSRRFFTISSAPEEGHILLTTRFSDPSSSFKKALRELKVGDEIVASNVEGEFVLPKDQNKKLVFIAGGIGITPFRSIVKHLIANKEKRDMVLLYSNRTAEDIVFKDIFQEAERNNGLRAIYALTEEDKIPSDWRGEKGFINENLINRQIPDFEDRIFYVSGPEPMVKAFEKMLKQMGVASKNIKRDYFPGYTG